MYKLLFLFLMLCTFNAFAQQDTLPLPLPQYLVTLEVPGFKLLLTDSATYYYKYQLPKKRPTIIIYFSPDCEHCQVEAQALTDSLKYVKAANIVYASYAPFVSIKNFDSTYKLSAQPNIKIGRDEKYYIPSFYRVRFTPFVALYNRKGLLVRVYEGGTPIINLYKELKKL